MGILDSLTKNPGLLGLAALGIGLFVFRDKISGFFSDITGGAAGAAQVAETGGILAGNLQSNLEGIQGITTGITDFFTGFQLPQINFPALDFFASGQPFPDVQDPIAALSAFARSLVPTESGDITTTPAAVGRASTRDRILDVAQIFVPEIGVVQSAIEGQQFAGGGPSFIGGTVFETPITGESTLGFIIDKLGVTASQAADIRAQAGGFTPEENVFLGIGTNPPVTSDPTFTDLTPEEIALRLTGGVITRF